ncbi:MAG: hypothetical protein R3C56_10885 [Pirellulaceae bacterium]
MDVMSEQGKQGSVFHSLKRKTRESEQMLTNLAGLHVLGVPIDWAAVNQSSEELVRLPKYPWNYASYWLESQQSAHERLDPIPHPLLGQRVASEKPTWQCQLDPRLFDYLHDHQIWDSIVFQELDMVKLDWRSQLSYFLIKRTLSKNWRSTKRLVCLGGQCADHQGVV